MIDYQTYCRIIQMRRENLRVSQIAEVLGLDERTVIRWLEEKNYHQRKTVFRESKRDPYKPQIIR